MPSQPLGKSSDFTPSRSICTNQTCFPHLTQQRQLSFSLINSDRFGFITTVLEGLRQELLINYLFITITVCSFNSKLIPKEDLSMEVRSRRYGTRTMFNTAANHQPEDYSTTTMRASFYPPQKHDRPNWRSRDPEVIFERTDKLKVKNKSDNLHSGYESNRQAWDGTTWRTEKNLWTDQLRTSYRNNFN